MKPQFLKYSSYAAYGISVGALVVAIGARYVPITSARTMHHPFTVVLEERTYNSTGGNERIASSQLIAVRSDGTRLVKLGGGLDGAGVRQIVYPSGEKVIVNDAFARKSTTRLPFIPEPVRTPESDCVRLNAVREHVTDRGIISGATAVKVWTPGDGLEMETWYAIDAGCALLERTINFATGEKSILRAHAFIPGEPNPALFTVGPEVVEGPPSELEPPEEDDSSCDEECQRRLADVRTRRDDGYHANRRRNWP